LWNIIQANGRACDGKGEYQTATAASRFKVKQQSEQPPYIFGKRQA
jgi:hypothetical protein